jgi:uncharacterized protein
VATLYLDTNILISAFIDDSGSAAAQAWIDANNDDWLVSHWAMSELIDNIGRRVRNKEFDESAGISLLGKVKEWAISAASFVDPMPEDFTKANELLLDFSLSLKANDALHIAAAMRTKSVMVSADRGLIAACSRLSVANIWIGNPH